MVLQIAAAASRAGSGDPMDQVIVAGAHELENWQSARTFPFTENRRRETTVLKTSNQMFKVVSKGAPETVSALCKLPKQQAAFFKNEVERFSSRGMKVIACAWKDQKTVPKTEPQSGFTLAGLIVLSDSVRPDVPAAFARARKEGNRIILVTGDHAATAAAVAAQLGFATDPTRLIEGKDLTPQLNAEGIDSFDIVARATPLQKRDLVAALKNIGHVVAVTGDGVNDVPALQVANIGITMGERGTRPAREAATIVLLNDSFATIVKAILKPLMNGEICSGICV